MKESLHGFRREVVSRPAGSTMGRELIMAEDPRIKVVDPTTQGLSTILCHFLSI
jgi:hypothetical protein